MVSRPSQLQHLVVDLYDIGKLDSRDWDFAVDLDASQRLKHFCVPDRRGGSLPQSMELSRRYIPHPQRISIKRVKKVSRTPPGSSSVAFIAADTEARRWGGCVVWDSRWSCLTTCVCKACVEFRRDEDAARLAEEAARCAKEAEKQESSDGEPGDGDDGEAEMQESSDGEPDDGDDEII